MRHRKAAIVRYSGRLTLALTTALIATPAVAQPSLPTAAVATDGFPMAGWHNGLFFLRDRNDKFRLYVQARMQVDAYTYLGPGVSQSTLKPTILLRRIRPELGGEILGLFNWMLAGDFGT